MAAWWEKMGALESIEHDPIQPQHLAPVIDQLAADDAILTSDSGTIATWAARHSRYPWETRLYLSGNLATMAPGLPYAIVAQVAHPGRQCVAFVGDGGLAMLMAEFATACRYRLPVKVIVNNNGELGQILWEQLVLGYPEFGVRFDNGSTSPRGPRRAEGSESVSISAESSRTGFPAVLPPRVRHLSTSRSTPTSPRCRARLRTNRRKAPRKAFLSGQPRRATIASTLFRDSSPS